MLATLAQLKARLAITEADTTDDAQIEAWIKLVSARFSRHCRRSFARSDPAVYEYRANEVNLVVDRYPVEVVHGFDLKISEGDGWVDQELSAGDYVIGPQRNTIELFGALGNSRELARVRFAGGYVLPGIEVEAGQTELPDDLNRACVEQVVYLWQNKNRLGLTTVGGTAGSLAQFAELDLLPLVKATLEPYIRITI